MEGATIPINPIALAIAAGATFVARSFAGDIQHLTSMIKMGINHRGFALIDILQPCPTLNHKNTYAWYRERVYKLENEVNYDASDRMAAFGKAQEWEPRIPIGVIYRKELPTFEMQLPALKKGPLVKQKIDPMQVEPLLYEFV